MQALGQGGGGGSRTADRAVSTQLSCHLQEELLAKSVAASFPKIICIRGISTVLWLFMGVSVSWSFSLCVYIFVGVR